MSEIFTLKDVLAKAKEVGGTGETVIMRVRASVAAFFPSDVRLMSRPVRGHHGRGTVSAAKRRRRSSGAGGGASGGAASGGYGAGESGSTDTGTGAEDAATDADDNGDNNSDGDERGAVADGAGALADGAGALGDLAALGDGGEVDQDATHVFHAVLRLFDAAPAGAAPPTVLDVGVFGRDFETLVEGRGIAASDLFENEAAAERLGRLMRRLLLPTSSVEVSLAVYRPLGGGPARVRVVDSAFGADADAE